MKVWLVLVLAAFAARSFSADKPNVIILIADQLRYQSVGYAGDTRARTPNIDRLASQGVNFDNFVSNTPVCSAFRASLLTGKYASSTGVVVNELRLNPNQDSLAHVFKRAGYATDHLGKWHLWANQAGRHNQVANAYTPPGPYRMGFDSFWAGYNFGHQNFQATYFRDTPEPIKIEGFSASHFTDLAIERIQHHQQQDEPFLMTVAYSPPHDPWVPGNVPAEWLAKFSEVEFPLPETMKDTPDPRMDRNTDPKRWNSYWKPRMDALQRVYYAMTASLDHEVGRLMQALKDGGMEDNTLLVFTSDHGEMFGAQGRVFKMTFYEEAARVPFLIRWPGHIPEGHTSFACMSTVDIMPTLLGLTALPIPPAVEGMDLSPAAQGQSGPEPEFAFLQGMGHTFLWNDGFEWRAIRDTEYTYARYRSDGKELLFHNARDPHQMIDLATVRPDVLRRMRKAMFARMETLDDGFEACSWYRDHWTENRVIMRGARGAFHRTLYPDVEVQVEFNGLPGSPGQTP
ncbi:MAG: arylsulfatase A-like enzyme [Verrucomicrobiales bacterium]|jgi:arylsulfatase A-like enzyme